MRKISNNFYLRCDIRIFSFEKNLKISKDFAWNESIVIFETCIENKDNVNFTHETTFVENDTTKQFFCVESDTTRTSTLKRKNSYEKEYETSISWIIYQIVYQIIESSQSTYNSMRFRRINIIRRINITIYLYEFKSS